MIDHPIRSARTQRRERALDEARQRLTHLEIETHRIKAELARLESENEDEIADELTRALGNEGGRMFSSDRSWAKVPVLRATTEEYMRLESSAAEHLEPTLGRPVAINFGVRKPAAGKPRRRISPAWMLSLGVHAAILALLAPLTYVVLSNDRVPLLASMFEAPSNAEESAAAPVELVSFEEIVPADDAIETIPDLADVLSDDLVAPVDPFNAGETASQLGELNALPTDVGTLMAGGGSGGTDRAPPRGRRGAAGDEARLGTASFFGTQARANRIVFVIDDSSSMKGGRLETAIHELIHSVESMTPKQSFYVIFVSDQPYPMFFPQVAPALVPATAQNKRQLNEWVRRVILAAGKNRELIKAMDMAAALNPDTVYLLWDGDLKYSEKVRQDVLAHLAQPNQWRFTIHTIGIDVSSLDSQFNLTAIAQAHGGTYRSVQAPGDRRANIP